MTFRLTSSSFVLVAYFLCLSATEAQQIVSNVILENPPVDQVLEIHSNNQIPFGTPQHLTVLESTPVTLTVQDSGAAVVMQPVPFCDQMQGSEDSQLVNSVFSILRDYKSSTEFKEKSLDLAAIQFKEYEDDLKQTFMEGLIKVAKASSSEYPLGVRVKAISILGSSYRELEDGSGLKKCVMAGMMQVASGSQIDSRVKSNALNSLNSALSTMPATPQPATPQPGTPQPGTPQPGTQQPGTPQPSQGSTMRPGGPNGTTPSRGSGNR